MTNTFDVIVGLVNLFLLFFVFKAFVIDPLKVVAKEREEKARRDQDTASSIHAEALTHRERYQKLLEGLEAEKAQIAQAAEADAERLRTRVAQEAENEARHIVSRADNEVRSMREGAVAELRAQVAEATVARARRLLESSVDAPARRDILENFLAKVGAADAR